MGRHDNPVVHPLPFPSRLHDPGAAEIREMPGDLRLRATQDFDEVTDADFLFSNQVKQAEPGLIPECLEESLDVEVAPLCHNLIFALTDASCK